METYNTCVIIESSQRKRRNVSSTIMYSLGMSGVLMTSIFWMAELIAEEDYVLSFKTKAMGWLASLLVGI
jgi:hypothetical protein